MAFFESFGSGAGLAAPSAAVSILAPSSHSIAAPDSKHDDVNQKGDL
jgi:hypothetical protein